MRAIAFAAAGTTLRELELGGCGASPEALADVNRVLLSNRIRHILLDQAGTYACLAGLGLTDAHVPSLMDALAANGSLRTLDLNGELYRALHGNVFFFFCASVCLLVSIPPDIRRYVGRNIGKPFSQYMNYAIAMVYPLSCLVLLCTSLWT